MEAVEYRFVENVKSSNALNLHKKSLKALLGSQELFRTVLAVAVANNG